MNLYKDVEKIFKIFIGKDASSVLDKFDNAKDYPVDFLEESNAFMSRLIGDSESNKLFKNIKKKYNLKPQDETKRI